MSFRHLNDWSDLYLTCGGSLPPQVRTPELYRQHISARLQKLFGASEKMPNAMSILNRTTNEDRRRISFGRGFQNIGNSL